ncbi:MAG: FAD-binding oxidoreductase [Petrimonas sp.]|nr:FAD-binding oxidoreductase [Petrimonas sp.]
MEEIVKVLSTEYLTHDVIRLVLEKPAGINFVPGQATEVAINKPEWKTKRRPFTFTSLTDDDFLEFVIKTYPSHNGVTNELLSIKPGDELIIRHIFGAIKYKGEGIFIAGGAGITPFIAILKELEKKNEIGNNKFIFANKARADIILEDKFNKLLGKNFINVLSEEMLPEYEHGYVSVELIKNNTDISTRYYYLCGPKPMMKAVEEQLSTLGIKPEFIVKESF